VFPGNVGLEKHLRGELREVDTVGYCGSSCDEDCSFTLLSRSAPRSLSP
jgi:hypothetical protein